MKAHLVFVCVLWRCFVFFSLVMDIFAVLEIESFHVIINRDPSIQSIQTGSLKNLTICSL